MWFWSMRRIWLSQIRCQGQRENAHTELSAARLVIYEKKLSVIVADKKLVVNFENVGKVNGA